MKKNGKTFLLTILFLILTCLLLRFPKESLVFSLTGLQLWFNKMIPALLPFMILSGMMIRLDLTESFVKLLSPVLTPLLRINLNGLYAVVIGFLCGFPMGAKVIADLYACQRLSKKEASFLLSFCNNIGPVYFISFVLPTLGLTAKIPYLFGMYGIPFLYGILLRHTLYRHAVSCPVPPKHSQGCGIKQFLSHAQVSAAESSGRKTPAANSLLDVLDDSILSGLYSISKLGGYMVLFNLFNLIPAAFLHPSWIAGADSGAVINCLLEITSGISRIGADAPAIVLLLLPFGGFSCIAQTYSMIKETDLSLNCYILHKVVLTLITLLYYGGWYLLFPASFLP